MRESPAKTIQLVASFTGILLRLFPKPQLSSEELSSNEPVDVPKPHSTATALSPSQQAKLAKRAQSEMAPSHQVSQSQTGQNHRIHCSAAWWIVSVEHLYVTCAWRYPSWHFFVNFWGSFATFIGPSDFRNPYVFLDHLYSSTWRSPGLALATTPLSVLR